MITAVTPPNNPGVNSIMLYSSDGQVIYLDDAFTYNPIPTIASVTPDHGISAGGAKIMIQGTGFLQGAIVTIGDKPATTQVQDDSTVEAVTPSLKQGVWDVRVVNPDEQEVIKGGGFISVGQVVYNYPNPFQAWEGTTFRCVTNEPVYSVKVRIFNMSGAPVDVVQGVGSNEVKWVNDGVHAGLYIYLMEVKVEDGETRQYKNVMEVYK